MVSEIQWKTQYLASRSDLPVSHQPLINCTSHFPLCPPHERSSPFTKFIFSTLSHSSAEPLPLMDLCRRVARLALGRERLQEIQSLPLPQSLKNYLQYQ